VCAGTGCALSSGQSTDFCEGGCRCVEAFLSPAPFTKNRTLIGMPGRGACGRPEKLWRHGAISMFRAAAGPPSKPRHVTGRSLQSGEICDGSWRARRSHRNVVTKNPALPLATSCCERRRVCPCLDFPMLLRERTARSLILVQDRPSTHKNPHLSFAAGYRATLVALIRCPRVFLLSGRPTA
jgi:hypothetical protein